MRRAMTQMVAATESLAEISNDAKRDTETMKTITVVTMVFLPATFVSVRFDPTTLLLH